jgi:hypothetical protein
LIPHFWNSLTKLRCTFFSRHGLTGMKNSYYLYFVSILFLLCAPRESRAQASLPAKSTIEKTSSGADRLTGRKIDRRQLEIHPQSSITGSACLPAGTKPRRRSAKKPR